MSKRSYNDFASADAQTEAADAPLHQKRAKVDEDVKKTVKGFMALVDGLQMMNVEKDEKGLPLRLRDLQPETKGDLKSLSRSLLHFLPTIKALAEEDEQEPEPEPESPTSKDASTGKPERVTRAVREKVLPQFLQNSSSGAIHLESQSILTKWTTSDIPSSLPPLPPILDQVLKKAAFTHSGLAQRPTDLSYERLEWLGDSYIYLISSGFIYATFPTFSPGQCAHIRETLTRNSTLATYSLQYGFDRRANFPPEFGLGGRPGGTKVGDSVRVKVLGDIFEAYVAAAVLSDPAAGFARVSAWLKTLWAGTIQTEIRNVASYERRVTELPPKTQLANLIVVKGIKLRYEDAPPTKSGPLRRNKDNRAQQYAVNVFLDGWGENGKLLGWGVAENKSEAGQRAALCAMKNKALIGIYAGRKREHMAALEAQRALEAEKTEE
jgi:ribonuclease-3